MPADPMLIEFGQLGLMPRIWLSLMPPHAPTVHYWAEELIEVAANVPIDVSNSLAFWGGMMRGKKARKVAFGGQDLFLAHTPEQAENLTYASLLSAVSSIGPICYFILRLPANFSAACVAAALNVLRTAKEEGLVEHFGVAPEGTPTECAEKAAAAEGIDYALVARNPMKQPGFAAVREVTNARGIGIISSHALNWGLGAPVTALPSMRERVRLSSLPGYAVSQTILATYSAENPVLVGVRTPREVERVIESVMTRPIDNLDEELRTLIEAYEGESDWIALRDDPRPWVRKAAERKLGNE